MWETVLGKQVARCDRNFFLLNLFGLAVLVLLVECLWGELYESFGPARTLDPVELVESVSPGPVLLPDAAVVDTGMRERRDGKDVAAYFAYPINDRILIVKLRTRHPGFGFSGVLKRVPSELQSRLQPSIGPDKAMRIFLDTTHGPRCVDYILVDALSGFALLVVTNLVRAVHRLSRGDRSNLRSRVVGHAITSPVAIA